MEDDSFDQEIKEQLDDLLGEKFSDEEIQQFFHSITSILNKEAKNLIKSYRKSNDIPQLDSVIQRNRPFYNNNNPYQINLFLYQNPQQNGFLYQQPPANPMATQNSPFMVNSFPFNHQHNQSKSSKKEKRKTKKKKLNVKEINYQGRDFDGIFNYLTKKTGGNIHKNGTITITASSVNRHSLDNPNPENVVDFSTESNSYKSSNDVLSWLCFDFKDQQIQLKNYSILSNNSIDFGQLRNWVIEVSGDGEIWMVIDSHSDDETLKRSRYVATFNIQKNDNKFYRYVRLRQTGRSWHNDGRGNLINIPKMEFYGNLKESK